MAYKERTITERVKVCDFCEAELCENCGTGACHPDDPQFSNGCFEGYCCTKAEIEGKRSDLTCDLAFCKDRIKQHERSLARARKELADIILTTDRREKELAQFNLENPKPNA